MTIRIRKVVVPPAPGTGVTPSIVFAAERTRILRVVRREGSTPVRFVTDPSFQFDEAAVPRISELSMGEEIFTEGRVELGRDEFLYALPNATQPSPGYYTDAVFLILEQDL
jgi:hypothetical protein